MELPVIKDVRGYEFQVLCPYEDCEKKIVFNRNSINELIECPNCRRELVLSLRNVQNAGLTHFKRLKAMANEVWDNDHQMIDWVECLKTILRNHRVCLSLTETYQRFRSEKWPASRFGKVDKRKKPVKIKVKA